MTPEKASTGPDSIDSVAAVLLNSKDLAVLCGAGISRNSGLPMARELICQILADLGADQATISEFADIALPFEVLMDTLVGDHHFDAIFDVFKGAEPNPAHHIIAALGVKGYCRTIATTNFDLLLESAFELLHADYLRVVTEEDFIRAPADSEALRLVKLHGSVDLTQSLRATLRDVADGKLGIGRRHAVEELFAGGTHRRVLIVGYSCSDIFDIVPFLKSLTRPRHEIILIDHVQSLNSYSFQALTDIEVNHALYGCKGQRVRCNTDVLLGRLGALVQVDTSLLSAIVQPGSWLDKLNNWRAQVRREPDLRPLLLGWILEKHGKYADAIGSYSEGLRLSGRQGNLGRLGPAVCMLNLANCLRQVGKASEAVGHFETSYRTASALDTKVNINSGYCAVLALIGLSNTLIDLGQIPPAERHARSAVKATQHLREASIKASALLALGRILTLQGKHPEAIECFEGTRLLLDRSGLIAALHQCDAHEGYTRYRMGEAERGLRLLEEAVQSAHRLNHWPLEFHSRLTLGSLYLEDRRWEDAIRSFAPAMKLGPPNTERRRRVHMCMGMAFGHRELRREEQYLECMGAALEIGTDHWLVSEESVTILRSAGLAWMKKADYDSAARAWKACIAMAEMLGLSDAIISCKVLLGDTFVKSGNSADALSLYQDALQVAEKTESHRNRLLCLIRIAQFHAHGRQHTDALIALGPAIVLAQQLGDRSAAEACNEVMEQLGGLFG